MKKQLLILTLILSVSVSGCSLPSLYEKDASKNAEANEEALEPLQEESNEPPAMVLNKADDAETEDEEITMEEPPEEEEDSFHGYVLSEEEKADPNVICMETKEEGQAELVFAGDINFDPNYSIMSTYKSIGNGMAGVLGRDLVDQFKDADIAMINNEFPYSDGGSPLANKTFTFRASPDSVKNLNEMGIDIVSLANNHAYDHGMEALLDTFDTLDGAGIAYVGAGHDIKEAMQPKYFIAGGMKIAYVSATQIERTPSPDTKEATEDSAGVLRTLDPERFLTVIKEASDNADLTVVYVHWGSENTYDVDDSQKSLARQYVESGADLIIGDHSHCLQGFEYVNGVPVIYSLGNFWFSSKDIDTAIVKAVVADKKVQSVQFVPCHQQNCKTRLLNKNTDGDYERILAEMVTLSFDVSIDEDGYVTNGAGTGVAAGPARELKKASYQTQAPDPTAVVIDPAAVVDPTAVTQ